MIEILKIIILKIFSILPDSPFRGFFLDMDTGFLEYLNWFLPLDICADMLLAWADCILIYFLFCMIKKYVFDKVISIVKDAVVAAFMFLG